MEKFVEYRKMSKKAKRELNLARRGVMGFNTGTRVHKDAKHPSRADQKKTWKKELDSY